MAVANHGGGRGERDGCPRIRLTNYPRGEVNGGTKMNFARLLSTGCSCGAGKKLDSIRQSRRLDRILAAQKPSSN